MSAAIHAAHVRCRMCSKFRHPREFIAGHIVGYCRDCFEWSNAKLRLLAEALEQGAPKSCPECNKSFDELSLSSPNGEVQMAMHRKDGIYQLVCLPCGAAYEGQRRDMFAGTPYAKRKGLFVV
jgi:hypothetical protein